MLTGELPEKQLLQQTSILNSMIIQPRTRKPSTVDKEKLGLFNAHAFTFLILWYFFSACTLFLNKYILATLRSDPTLLGAMQMVMTTVFGFIQMYLPLGMYTPVNREGKPPNFWRNMILVGTTRKMFGGQTYQEQSSMVFFASLMMMNINLYCYRFTRFSTVVLGLVALKFVAVSFTETVKSSAPLFTVFISKVLIGEFTGIYTFFSLIPIMLGLGLCSAYELSFNIQGFVAAMATNLTECLQNVYSKLLISGEKYKYTPAELQFYTSIASIVVQIPACFIMMDLEKVHRTLDMTLLSSLLLNGVFFHFQSISAYVLMDYISPVTHSVANTVKRAFLIWLSVVLFGNPVTFLSGLGTVIVTIGVLLYTKAKEHDQQLLEIREKYRKEVVDKELIVRQL